MLSQLSTCPSNKVCGRGVVVWVVGEAAEDMVLLSNWLLCSPLLRNQNPLDKSGVVFSSHAVNPSSEDDLGRTSLYSSEWTDDMKVSQVEARNGKFIKL